MSNPTDNLDSSPARPDSATSQAPLNGVRVAVTRPANQAAHLSELLAESGATVILTPLIRIADPADPTALDRAISRIDVFDWMVFTSANGAIRFLEALARRGRPAGLMTTPRIAVVGPATAAAVRERGGVVSLLPERFDADSLASALSDGAAIAGARVLVACAAAARDTVPHALAIAGALVETVHVYQTLPDDDAARHLADLIAWQAVDVVTFASGSAVRALALHVSAEQARGARFACIGPVTSDIAREHGFDVWAHATEHTDEGLVRAIIDSGSWSPR